MHLSSKSTYSSLHGWLRMLTHSARWLLMARHLAQKQPCSPWGKVSSPHGMSLPACLDLSFPPSLLDVCQAVERGCLSCHGSLGLRQAAWLCRLSLSSLGAGNRGAVIPMKSRCWLKPRANLAWTPAQLHLASLRSSLQQKEEQLSLHLCPVFPYKLPPPLFLVSSNSKPVATINAIIRKACLCCRRSRW